MHQDGVRFLDLMFKPGENICPGPNKYAYHSVPVEEAKADKVLLRSSNPNCRDFEAPTDSLLTVALNPINGFRCDANCTAFRNFLVELDSGPIESQMQYIRDMFKMPYSAAVFSGSKSLHFLISLDKDLRDIKDYRFISYWIRNILTMADKNCVNPSRGIRIPGAEREPGKFQTLVEYKGPVSVAELYSWLMEYESVRPVQQKERSISESVSDISDLPKLRYWVINSLKNGIDASKGRNSQWFSIACEFALKGLSEEDATAILQQYFVPDDTFKEKEWLQCIKYGYKYIYENRK